MVGVPPALRQLGERDGLPPLPTVDVCLHAGGGDAPSALVSPKRVVVDTLIANLADAQKASGRHAARSATPARRIRHCAL
ncbi:LysR family transcriptional regulator [Burkholderia lata]|nr:LysR family transcriptional regulator [Burkholderia lata]